MADQRDAVQERAEDIPLLGWLFKPIAGLVFDTEEASNTRKGERGEASVLEALLHALPESWVVFHNVVVEPRPDAFAQIDLLAVGPAGLFLIETKAWRGSFKAYRDRWQYRDGNRWSDSASPTPMVLRTARHGAGAGQQFYGCRNYPQCRELLPSTAAAFATQQGQQTSDPVSPAYEPVTPAPPATAPEPTSPPVFSTIYRCGACQAEVSRTARFCQQCGAAL